MTDSSKFRKTIDLLPGDLYVEILKSFRKFGVFGCQIAIIREIDGEVEPLGVSYPIGTLDGKTDVVGEDIFPLGGSTLFIALVALHKALELKGYSLTTPLKEVVSEMTLLDNGIDETKNCVDILNHKKCTSGEIDENAKKIIEQLSKKDYVTFVQEEVLTACNMKCSKIEQGKVWSNGRDLLKFHCNPQFSKLYGHILIEDHQSSSQSRLVKSTYAGVEVYEIESEDDQYGNLTVILGGHRTQLIVLYKKSDGKQGREKEDFVAWLKPRLIEHLSKLVVQQ
ncbi:hypothetical protein L486_07662 [Kwoniella mangroviensis CBS 10435]|uniref:Uncharacterized protein n=1 Tax=Kwoniella mangroviensis CBS 10435 TaxID=1331196 RepID=A0A1B9IHA4_9TREE|nr:hypothetical protein L486_07662 [Kwoniella mangroviensis CBS 10435]